MRKPGPAEKPWLDQSELREQPQLEQASAAVGAARAYDTKIAESLTLQVNMMFSPIGEVAKRGLDFADLSPLLN